MAEEDETVVVPILSGGKWANVAIPDYRDGEKDGDYYRRVGLTPMDTLGSEQGVFSPSTLLVREDSTQGGPAFPAKYAIRASLGEYERWMLADDVPSMMMIWQQVSSIYANGLLSYRVEELAEVADRMIRAYHGHGISSACNQCDPEEARMRRETRARLAAVARARTP